MSYVWGVAFSKDIGAEKTPRSNSARVVSVAYALLALIMVNTYCANLMAFLLQEPDILPITGVRDAKVGEVYSRDLIDLFKDVSAQNVLTYRFSKPAMQ